MYKSRNRPLKWSWLIAVLTVLGFGLATPPAPAHAAPSFPLDPSALVGQVGPQVVNINTKLATTTPWAPDRHRHRSQRCGADQ